MPSSDRLPRRAGPGRPGPAAGPPASAERLAGEIIGLAAGGGVTIAVAESLTGGLVAAALTSVAGSSAVVRGGIVAYATELKAELLGVPAAVLAQHGPVHPAVAAAMASGVRERLRADYGAATTGVAGPGPAEGRPAGTVFIAVAGPARTAERGLKLPGDRRAVRAETVQSVLSLLVSALREDGL